MYFKMYSKCTPNRNPYPNPLGLQNSKLNLKPPQTFFLRIMTKAPQNTAFYKKKSPQVWLSIDHTHSHLYISELLKMACPHHFPSFPYSHTYGLSHTNTHFHNTAITSVDWHAVANTLTLPGLWRLECWTMFSSSLQWHWELSGPVWHPHAGLAVSSSSTPWWQMTCVSRSDTGSCRGGRVREGLIV